MSRHQSGTLPCLFFNTPYHMGYTYTGQHDHPTPTLAMPSLDWCCLTNRLAWLPRIGQDLAAVRPAADYPKIPCAFFLIRRVHLKIDERAMSGNMTWMIDLDDQQGAAEAAQLRWRTILPPPKSPRGADRPLSRVKLPKASATPWVSGPVAAPDGGRGCERGRKRRRPSAFPSPKRRIS